MKNSTKKLFKRVKLFAFCAFLASSVNLLADNFYVRTAGDATSWSALTGITPSQIISSNTPNIIGTNTYYFAKGTYGLSTEEIDPITSLPVLKAPIITTGKLYGGFSGSESSINLATRALLDKDGNGIVEPWEMVNEVIFSGTVPMNDLIGAANRLIILQGGEANGVSFNNHYYFGDLVPVPAAYSGAIIIGKPTSFPQIADDILENGGKLVNCIVRKIKAGGQAPIMMTTQYALIDKCLIEDCISEGLLPNSGGGAIFMNTFGGKVSNSVLRNNYAKSNASNGGRGGAIYALSFATLKPENSKIVENCLIYNNTSDNWGGAIRIDGIANKPGGHIVNCTLANNSTNGLGSASVELIQSGLIVNSIVVGDTKAELRLHSKNNYSDSNIFGEFLGEVSSPGTNMISGQLTTDLGFVNPTTFAGATELPGSDFFDQAAYDEVRKANFKINSAASIAATTTALTTLPDAYTVNAAILIATKTIPSTDLLGIAPTTTRTIGAYQFTNPNAFAQIYGNKLNAYAVENGIVVKESAGKMVSLFSVSGQLVKKVALESNTQTIPATKGFYFLTVGNAVAKIIVR